LPIRLISWPGIYITNMPHNKSMDKWDQIKRVHDHIHQALLYLVSIAFISRGIQTYGPLRRRVVKLLDYIYQNVGRRTRGTK
jgi:cytosine/adenosine deaminase-related metal-dependent hydrolase